MDEIWYVASQHPSGFTALGFLLAIGLYYLRERVRTVYAATEIAVGIIALWNAVPTFSGGFSDEFAASDFQIGSETRLSALTIIGALYIIVRGLDNLDKGLSSRSAWKRVRRAVRLSPP